MISKIVKAVYRAIPFKAQFYPLIRTFFRPSERIYRHLHFNGIFRVNVDGERSFLIRHHGYPVENDLFWSGIDGEWERTSLSLWKKLCEKSNHILDIGANTGVYALIAKTINPTARVMAIEPVKRIHEKLLDNVALNKFDVTCVEAAASNANGTATIYDTNADHLYSVTVNKDLNVTGTPTTAVEVKTIRLDALLQQSKWTSVDLIKLDVETHEPEVLEGMGQLLRTSMPSILIEILNDTVAVQIAKVIEGLPYLYFNIDEHEGPKVVKTLGKSLGHNFLLCTRQVASEIGLH